MVSIFQLPKVDRFGKTNFYVMFDYHVFTDGCSSDKTVIPSHSGKQDLVLVLFWPETNIGEEAVVSCPCGNGSSGGQILQASRYCGGDFTRGAEWSKGNVAACNFSDLAREICQLIKVCLLDVNTEK